MVEPRMQPNAALEQFLKSIPLFSLVEPADMVDLLRLLRPVTLEKDQVLFRENDAGDAMWVLGKGTEVTILTHPMILVAKAREGETVGEMALVDDQGRSGTAVVTGGGPAHQIYGTDFEALRSAYNPAAFKILRRIALVLCARLRATRDRIAPSSEAASAVSPPPGRPLPAEAALEEFEPFRALPQTVKLALQQKLQLIETQRPTPLFSEGAPTDGAYFVVSGRVALSRRGAALGELEAGSMFGLVACLDEGPRSASAATVGPARLLRLTDKDFDALFARGNRFAFQLVDIVCRQLSARLRDTNTLLPTAAPFSEAAPRPPPRPAAAPPPASTEPTLELDFEL